MKRAFLIISVLPILALIAWGYSATGNHRLKSFCQKIPKGSSVIDVRLSAEKSGFDPLPTKNHEMRIRSGQWGVTASSCLVFFNQIRTVEYRHFEES